MKNKFVVKLGKKKVEIVYDWELLVKIQDLMGGKDPLAEFTGMKTESPLEFYKAAVLILKASMGDDFDDALVKDFSVFDFQTASTIVRKLFDAMNNTVESGEGEGDTQGINPK